MAITEESQAYNPTPSAYFIRRDEALRAEGDWYMVWEVYRRGERYPLCECATEKGALLVQEALELRDKLSVREPEETA